MVGAEFANVNYAELMGCDVWCELGMRWQIVMLGCGGRACVIRALR